MFKTIREFEEAWSREAAVTGQVMEALTDESLGQPVTEKHRTLGRLAWHIVVTIHEMLSRTGLEFEAPGYEEPVPTSAKAISDAYRQAGQAMLEAVRTQWTDETLLEKNNMYGDMWPNGVTLRAFIQHEIHHRGQMTVLMRQAGLKVPDIYGPALESWVEFGMEPPAV